MKLKLKMIAIAAALASLAGGAQADITTTFTNNGNLVLTVINQSSGASYIRDLGFTMNTFLPNGVAAFAGDQSSALVGDKSPEAGLVLNAGNTANFGDAAWASFYAAQSATLGDLRWLVSAGDDRQGGANGFRRVITSSADGAVTASNGQIDNFTNPSNYGSLQAAFNPATLSKADNTGANPYQASLNGNFGLDLLGSDLALIGGTANLFYFARTTTSGATATPGTSAIFGNSGGAAVLSFAANGDFSYTLAPAVAEVPLPAAAWMMGAGLMAIGGMIRRRKAAAQA